MFKINATNTLFPTWRAYTGKTKFPNFNKNNFIYSFPNLPVVNKDATINNTKTLENYMSTTKSILRTILLPGAVGIVLDTVIHSKYSAYISFLFVSSSAMLAFSVTSSFMLTRSGNFKAETDLPEIFFASISAGIFCGGVSLYCATSPNFKFARTSIRELLFEDRLRAPTLRPTLPPNHRLLVTEFESTPSEGIFNYNYPQNEIEFQCLDLEERLESIKDYYDNIMNLLEPSTPRPGENNNPPHDGIEGQVELLKQKDETILNNNDLLFKTIEKFINQSPLKLKAV